MLHDCFLWNSVYRYIASILKKCRDCDVEYCDDTVPFKDIIAQVGTEEDIKIASILQFTRYKNFLLIRYGSYADIYSGESEVTPDEIWDMYDGFYRECRSLVVDLCREEIVLSPFRKFRNLNEGEENSLKNIKQRIANCKSLEVSNKLDGSMQSATWYHGELVMSGSRALDPNESWRLQDGMSMPKSNPGYIKMLKGWPEYTFIFEYISLKDAHVVKYTKEQEGLYLIGIRDKRNGNQLSYKEVLDYSNRYNVKTTQVFNKTLDDVLQDIKVGKADEMEGYVLNIDGYLVKIKCDDYVCIHKAISGLCSPNSVIKAIADDTFDDFISKIPQAYKEKIMEIAEKVVTYVATTGVDVKLYCELGRTLTGDSKKDFMIWVDKCVPEKLKGYVRNSYLGIPVNYLKSGNKECPHYKKISELQ